MKSACDYPLIYRLQNQRGNQRVLRSLFPRPDVSTVLLFAVFLLVAVQQHVGQDAVGDSEEKQSSVTLPVLITEP